MKSLLVFIVGGLLLVGCGNPDDVLIQAVKDGNSSSIKKAIADGPDVNTKDEFGRTPFHFATFYGHKEIEWLFEKPSSTKK